MLQLGDKVALLIVDECAPNLTRAEAQALFEPLLKVLASFKDANRPSCRMPVIMLASLLDKLLSRIEGAVIQVKGESRAGCAGGCRRRGSGRCPELP